MNAGKKRAAKKSVCKLCGKDDSEIAFRKPPSRTTADYCIDCASAASYRWNLLTLHRKGKLCDLIKKTRARLLIMEEVAARAEDGRHPINFPRS